MKQRFYLSILALVFVLICTDVSANPKSSELKAGESKLPTTPAELLVFLTGTTWQLQSAVGQYFGEGAVVFLDKGKVEHIYKDGAMHKKHWGVTADMKLIWGGRYIQICRFPPNYKLFAGSLNHTTGRRLMRPNSSENEATTKER